MPLIIKVTYGTRAHEIYARVPDKAKGKRISLDWDTAEALRDGAVERGYTDAVIVDEKDFREAQDKARYRETYPRSDDRRAA